MQLAALIISYTATASTVSYEHLKVAASPKHLFPTLYPLKLSRRYKQKTKVRGDNGSVKDTDIHIWYEGMNSVNKLPDNPFGDTPN